ncbi:hypothetical protein ACP4OV_016806 [Aristida adscensionis]
MAAAAAGSAGFFSGAPSAWLPPLALPGFFSGAWSRLRICAPEEIPPTAAARHLFLVLQQGSSSAGGQDGWEVSFIFYGNMRAPSSSGTEAEQEES